MRPGPIMQKAPTPMPAMRELTSDILNLFDRKGDR
jgi:hypothetical protein